MYLKTCITGQIDAFHLGQLLHNEVYQLAKELVHALAKMLVEITIV